MRQLLVSLLLVACGGDGDGSHPAGTDPTPDPEPTDPGAPLHGAYRFDATPGFTAEAPVDLDFLPQAPDRFLVAEASGHVSLVTDTDGVLAEADGPAGPLAIAVEPDGASVLVLTADAVLRVPLTVGDAELGLGTPETVLEIADAGPDGDLAVADGWIFVATGTTVLRVAADGSPAPGNADGVDYGGDFASASTIAAFNHGVFVGDDGPDEQWIGWSDEAAQWNDVVAYPNDDEALAGDDHDYTGGATERSVRVGCVPIAGADDPYDGALHQNLVYGDHEQGWVRARAIESDGGGDDITLGHVPGVVAMAASPSGLVVAVSDETGLAYRLRKSQTLTELGETGDRLSDEGLFVDVAADPLEPVDGVIPYEVLWPLYADGHEKDRYIQLPAGETIDATDDLAWQFPEGTRMIKTFSVGEDLGGATRQRKVETRILEKRAGVWIAGTFLWNADETEAYLSEGLQRMRYQVEVSDDPPTREDYFLPGVSDCRTCHGSVGEWVLGFSHFQLGDAMVASVGDLWGTALGAAPVVTGTPEQIDARGFLHGNCAHCHHPGGVLGGAIDFRFSVAEAEMGVVGVAPQHLVNPAAGHAADLIVTPGDPDHSTILWEVGEHLMPPVGVTTVNDDGLEILRAWIAAM